MATKGLVGGISSPQGFAVTTSVGGDELQSNTTQQGSAVTASVAAPASYTASVNMPEAATVDYAGQETDSVVITVDNKQRTIRGDVKWRSMLALTDAQEDSSHAYLASKAKLKFQDVDSRLQQINNELVAVKETSTEAAAIVGQYDDELNRIDETIQTNKSAQDAIRRDLTAEISRRELEHLELRKTDRELLDTFKKDLLDLEARTSANLDRHGKLVEQLAALLDTQDVSSKEALDKTNTRVQQLTGLISGVHGDVIDIRSAYQKLQEEFHEFISSRVMDDIVDYSATIDKIQFDLAALNTTLSSTYETTQRALDALNVFVVKHESRLTGLTAEVKTYSQVVEHIESSQHATQQDVETLQKQFLKEVDDRLADITSLSAQLMGEMQIRRESDDFHEDELARLELRISNLQNDLTKVIQNFVNEFRRADDELANRLTNVSYEFIDAGNAPI